MDKPALHNIRSVFVTAIGATVAVASTGCVRNGSALGFDGGD